jgi:hypothetical protein
MASHPSLDGCDRHLACGDAIEFLRNPVLITGTGLASATAVMFAGVPAAFTPQGDGALLASVPGSAGRGPIAVTTPFGSAVSAAEFMVTEASGPVITGFAPTRAAPGMPVRIDGRNFFNLVVVDLGGALLKDVQADPTGTRIDAKLPFNANTGRFLVRTASGSALSEVFIVETTVPPPPPVPTAPQISAFRPVRGRAGTPVTVAGSGFVDGATSVSFNGVPAAASVLDATRLSAVVPPGASSGPLQVNTPGGSALSGQAFNVF